MELVEELKSNKALLVAEQEKVKSLEEQLKEKNDEVDTLTLAAFDDLDRISELEEKIRSFEKQLIDTMKMGSWILVLNNKKPSNVPMIIDGKGRSKEIGFAYGPETQARQSCSIIWHGQMFLFGGYPNKRQISVVDGCQLTKKGELPFKMNVGACAQRDNAEIFICFEVWDDESTWKNCRRSTGPLESFSKLPSSTYKHRSTRIAVNSGTEPFFASQF